MQEITGRFWLAGTDGPRRPGILRIEKESAPLLTVDGALTAMMRLVSVTGEGDTAVSRYEPMNDLGSHTVHGVADDGTAVTVLDALNRGFSGGMRPVEQTQTLQGTYAVIGCHLGDRNYQFRGFRVRIQSLTEMLRVIHGKFGNKETPLNTGGSLRVEADQDGPWLVLEHVPLRNIRGFDRQYLRPLCTLLTLASKNQIGLLELQLQEPGGTSWWPAHSASHRKSDIPFRQDALIRRSDISPEVLATWLDRADKLGPLPAVVATGLSGPMVLEATVLALTTVAEGLHRRLRPDTLRFSKEAGTAIRDAAAAAAERVESGSGDAVRGYLNYVHEVSYGTRLLDLAETVQPFMPEVTGRTSRWKAAVYAARNDFAHRATQEWFEEPDYDKYVAVALSLQWLLRGLLISESGIPLEVLAARFQEHEEYRLFLEQAPIWQPRIYRPQGSTGD